CIGYYNARWFILFLLAQFNFIFHQLFLFTYVIHQNVNNAGFLSSSSTSSINASIMWCSRLLHFLVYDDPFVRQAWLTAFCFTVFLATLIVYQLYFTAVNITGNESIKSS